jgi:protein gp37
MIDIKIGRYWDLPLSWIDGCTPCSPGCEHCWSAAMATRFRSDAINRHLEDILVRNGKFTGRIKIHPDRLDIPLKRKKPTVYSLWNDLFHEDVPMEFIAESFNVMAGKAPQHKYLVLTKRPQRMMEFFKWSRSCLDFFPHIYLGLTVCNQQEADEKIPIFLQVPGKKFLSIEPCISNISLWGTYLNIKWVEYFDVVIMGAETGASARPMDLEWARTIRDECEVAGTPFFLKQTDKKHNRLLDVRTHDELPWIVPTQSVQRLNKA